MNKFTLGFTNKYFYNLIANEQLTTDIIGWRM